MQALTFSNIAWFFASVALQVIALSALPASAGFTRPLPTLIVCVGIVAGLGIFARLAASGVELSLLIPISAAIVPLTIVLIDTFINGNPASAAKIALLCGSCGLIGYASTL